MEYRMSGNPKTTLPGAVPGLIVALGVAQAKLTRLVLEWSAAEADVGPAKVFYARTWAALLAGPQDKYTTRASLRQQEAKANRALSEAKAKAKALQNKIISCKGENCHIGQQIELARAELAKAKRLAMLRAAVDGRDFAIIRKLEGAAAEMESLENLPGREQIRISVASGRHHFSKSDRNSKAGAQWAAINLPLPWCDGEWNEKACARAEKAKRLTARRISRKMVDVQPEQTFAGKQVQLTWI
jgi:hypothetical protein